MSISNHSVNVKASTAELEKQLEGYEASYARLMDVPEVDDYDDSQLEWLESGIELIEEELERRVSPDYPEDHDSDSLQDRGIEMGSYAS